MIFLHDNGRALKMKRTTYNIMNISNEYVVWDIIARMSEELYSSIVRAIPLFSRSMPRGYVDEYKKYFGHVTLVGVRLNCVSVISTVQQYSAVIVKKNGKLHSLDAPALVTYGNTEFFLYGRFVAGSATSHPSSFLLEVSKAHGAYYRGYDGSYLGRIGPIQFPNTYEEALVFGETWRINTLKYKQLPSLELSTVYIKERDEVIGRANMSQTFFDTNRRKK